MTLASLRAVFMRGGTSKAVFFRREDLPQVRDPDDPREWDDIFRTVMGSPDPKARQLDGMGGGLSSLSKVAVVSQSKTAVADIDFTFAQIGVRDGAVGYRGTCGNITAAVATYAIDAGWVSDTTSPALVRIFNTNTKKLVHAHVPMNGSQPSIIPESWFALHPASGIRLDFLDPAGAATGRLLPTGSPCDTFEVAGFGAIRMSCVDAANPTVLVAGSSFGLTEPPSPEALESRKDIMHGLEHMRRTAARAMGLARTDEDLARITNLPLVALLFPAKEGEKAHVHTRMISAGQPHRATPLTGAMCLAAAAKIPNTLPWAATRRSLAGPLLLGHASGTISVDATVAVEHGDVQVISTSVFRTARRLMEGRVFFPAAL
jgi:2-methylaconitate cis-trans-isomerase PrpF